MTDLKTPATLPNAYMAQNAQSTDEAAYASEMARLGAQQAQGQLAGRPAAPPQGSTQTSDQAAPESMMDTEVTRFTQASVNKPKYAPVRLEDPSTPAGSDTMPGPQHDFSNAAALRYLKQIPDTLSHTFDSPYAVVAAPFGVAGSLIAAAGTGQISRGIYMGVHDAVKSVFQLADDLDAWTSTKLNDWHLSALNAAIGHDRGAGLLSGYHLLSGDQVNQQKLFGSSSEFSSADVASKALNPFNMQEPRNPVGIAVKNASQFITGMMFAGKQLRALSLPTNTAGWLGRGVTAAQGFSDSVQCALNPSDALSAFLGAARALETAAAIRKLGLQPAPSGVRHFLPPVDETAMLNPPPASPKWELRWIFEGFRLENISRYVWAVSEGSCLTPDLPTVQLGWYDPVLPVRHGDVAGIAIEVPGQNPYPCVKHIQNRDGMLWACSNDGDLPLSEHTRVVGRLVMALTPV